MSVIDQNLLPGEKIVHRTRYHQAVLFVQPVTLLVTALFPLLLAPWRSSGIGVAVAAFGVLAAVASFVSWFAKYLSFEAVLTNKRVLTKSGLLSTKCNEILFTKVEAIDVEQNLLGRVIGYGKTVITGTGGSKNPISNIPDPFAFRKTLQQQVAAAQAQPVAGSVGLQGPAPAVTGQPAIRSEELANVAP